MAQQDQLQPSLLDRLTDDEPGSQQEGRERRVMSFSRLREAVRRDLAWLLNATDLMCLVDLTDYPQVAESVLNYGLPPLSGRTASSVDADALERTVRQVISTYEPRVLRKTLKVKAVVQEEEMTHNALSFVIEGELWAQPVPMRFLLRTEVDLESGKVTIDDKLR